MYQIWAKYSKQTEDKCYTCGNNHSGEKCDSFNCANCEAAKISKELGKHSARDKTLTNV